MDTCTPKLHITNALALANVADRLNSKSSALQSARKQIGYCLAYLDCPALLASYAVCHARLLPSLASCDSKLPVTPRGPGCRCDAGPAVTSPAWPARSARRACPALLLMYYSALVWSAAPSGCSWCCLKCARASSPAC